MEESLNLLEMRKISEISANKKKPSSYSPLALAYIGDSVFDLLIKTHMVTIANKQPYKYHREVSDIVKAKSQAIYAEKLLPKLTEEESDIYKRGRNATTHTKAKNASVIEYRKATGFEALIGYLYLKGDTDRLEFILNEVLNSTL